MDTEKAKVILTVLKEGSFSAAAKTLGYTTSGISRSVASLEEEAGIRLLVRGKNGVYATKEAELLLPVMRTLVHQENLYREQISQLHGLEIGTVTIGISYAAYFKIVAQKIRRFVEKYPGIRVRTMQGTSTELLHALDQREVDFAVMTYRESDYHFHELCQDPMVACIPANHPAADDEVFPLSLYGKEPVIAAFPDRETDHRRAIEQAGIPYNVQYTTTDIFAAYCMVEAGLGIALFNRLEVGSWRGNVKILPTDPPINLRIGITYPDPEEMTIAARKFLEDWIREQTDIDSHQRWRYSMR